MQDLRTITDARLFSSALTGEPIGVGSLLAGRYRIRRFLAAGGMGEVYEADDTLLGDPVAIKLLRKDLIRKPHAHARFAEEIRLARRVTHPNVCRVFDVGVDGDRVFYTMELHPGVTLAERLEQNGPLSIEQLRPIASQVLAGIAAAHAADIVHADLKPSNVLVAANGRVVVTDFGLALPLCAGPGCTCEMPHLVGTPAYMAPEQVTGGEIVESTDLFSFGVIAFELLTGRLPWEGKSAIELATARLDREPASLRELRPDIDETWERVIASCLRKDAAERPQRTTEICDALGL